MNKRITWLALAVFATVVAPCLALAQTQIVVWHAYRGKEKVAFEQVVADFNAGGHDFTVKTLGVPYDAYADKITAAVPRGKGPDVFIYAQDRLGGWVEAGGTIEPIDFYIDEEMTGAFIPATMEAMTYQGNVYGLPVNFKVLTMIYNKALVTTPPATSSELVATAKGLTDAGAGKFGLAYNFGDFYYHSALMNAFGGNVFAGSNQPLVNKPENIASVELMMEWFDVHGILPAEPSSTLITTLFNKGDAAMVFSGPWFLSEIADGVDYGLAVLPTIDEAGGAPMAPWMTVEGAYIAAPSEHKDEAFAFVQHLTGVEAGRVMALGGRQTPANMAVYEDAEVAADPVLAAFREQVEVACPMPNYAEMTMVWSPVTTAMNAVVRKASSPQAAFDAAQEDVEERVKSLRK
ncbi:MAG: extracellular solute-binding protein [bacterium]|nr:extracellular solute-binding protein [bacterium]